MTEHLTDIMGKIATTWPSTKSTPRVIPYNYKTVIKYQTDAMGDFHMTKH